LINVIELKNTEMSKIPQLKHIGLYVENLAKMEAFYTSVFDLIVTDRGQVERLNNRKIVFMSGSDQAHHPLVLIEGKDPASGPSVVFQMSFFVDAFSDLRRIETRLQQAKVGSIHPITHGNAWSIYAQDPEGNGLEIYMDTPWYVPQPHGKPFDLSWSDEEIYTYTQSLIENNPDYASQQAWQNKMQTKIKKVSSSIE
jgi:catechol 2,3-dioxygenase